MKTLHWILAVVALVGFVVYPFSLVATDTTPTQFEDAADDVRMPYEDTPWYMVGAAPLLIISGVIAGVVTVALEIIFWLGGGSK